MDNRIKELIFFIVFLLMGTSCTLTNSSPPTPTVATENMSQENDIINSSTSVPSSMFSAPWEDRCGVQKVVEPGASQLPASIVVSLSGGSNKIIHPDFSMTEFKLSRMFTLNVSPGGQWFSYWQKQAGENRRVEPPILEIQSVSGDEHYEYMVPSIWFPYTPWYSPDYLRVVEEAEEEIRRSYLLSPEGERLDLPRSDLPNLSQIRAQTNIWISPDYLFYRTQSTTFALWDIKNEALVWESEKDLYIDVGEITWSPDGKHVAFLARSLEKDNPGLLEIFVLSTDGQLVQKTEFNKYFNDYSLLALKWSLDSDKLLFVLQNNENVVDGTGYQYYLLMLELSSDSTFNFCLSGYRAVEPWSPDSSMIAFVGVLDNQDKLIILDTETGDALIAPYDICSSSDCEPSDEFGLTNVLGWIVR